MTDWKKGFKIESDGTTAGTKVYDSAGKLLGCITEFHLHLHSDTVYPELEVVEARPEGYVIHGGARSGVAGQITKMELNVDNLIKCSQRKYRAYLPDDDILEETLGTGEYCGEHNLEVYLDGFVCEKNERSMTVNGRKVIGKSDFTARAARFGFHCAQDSSKGWIETFLDGHLHLVWFIDDRLVWVVKNLAVTDHLEEWVGDAVYLLHPLFVAAGIIDLRETCLEGEQGKRVVGWTKAALRVAQK